MTVEKSPETNIGSHSVNYVLHVFNVLGYIVNQSGEFRLIKQ